MRTSEKSVVVGSASLLSGSVLVNAGMVYGDGYSTAGVVLCFASLFFFFMAFYSLHRRGD